MHCLCNKEKENCIEEYAERETAMARQQVEDADEAITQ
jgi:hypothetical protein